MNKPMTPPLELHKWDAIILTKAEQFNISAYILSAMIWKECEEDVGNPCLTRFEPKYQYFWHPVRGALWKSNLSVQENRNIAEQLLGRDEFIFQCTSFGLMQILMAVARELGFKGSPQDLCNPERNIFYGCLHLSNLLRRAHGDYKMALLRYNGSILYSTEVLRRAAILEKM